MNRLHKSWPNIWSDNLADYDIVGHNVGIRPGRKSGVRVEKEVKNGLNIVHAYGESNRIPLSTCGVFSVPNVNPKDFPTAGTSIVSAPHVLLLVSQTSCSSPRARQSSDLCSILQHVQMGSAFSCCPVQANLQRWCCRLLGFW